MNEVKKMKKIIVLSEDAYEALKTEELFKDWGWNHVVVCSTLPGVIGNLRANPFQYILVVIERVCDPDIEDQILAAILNSHPRISVVVRSAKKKRAGYHGRVSYLRADTPWDALADIMDTVYRDETLQYQLGTGFSEKKLRDRLNRKEETSKVIPFRGSNT